VGSPRSAEPRAKGCRLALTSRRPESQSARDGPLICAVVGGLGLRRGRSVNLAALIVPIVQRRSTPRGSPAPRLLVSGRVSRSRAMMADCGRSLARRRVALYRYGHKAVVSEPHHVIEALAAGRRRSGGGRSDDR
jgi:hypothetical protein